MKKGNTLTTGEKMATVVKLAVDNNDYDLMLRAGLQLAKMGEAGLKLENWGKSPEFLDTTEPSEEPEEIPMFKGIGEALTALGKETAIVLEGPCVKTRYVAKDYINELTTPAYGGGGVMKKIICQIFGHRFTCKAVEDGFMHSCKRCGHEEIISNYVHGFYSLHETSTK